MDHREREAQFREQLLDVLGRIASALEERNSGLAASRELIHTLKNTAQESAGSESAPQPPRTRKNRVEQPSARSYEDYREWDQRADGSILWHVKIDGEWVEANALESRLFDARLRQRQGK